MKTFLPLIILALFSCESKEIHEYSIDTPTEQGHYLTWVNIKKTALKNQGDTTIVQEHVEINQWEVLEFNHDFTSAPKWNTLHFKDWEVTVLYWTTLPPTP